MAVKYPLWPNGIYDFYYGPYFVPLLPSFLLLCTVILIVYLRRSSLRLPQVPPALPGIGHLHLLGTEPHRSLWELSKRYGPLMFLRFGSVPVIVASTPDMARLILQKHDQIFCYRSPSAVSTQILECKDMLFSQPGPYFKLIRQLSFSDLFANKRLESFRSFILNEIRHLLCDVADSSSKISVREKLYETGLSIISRMTVGKHVKDIISDSSTGPTHNLVDVMIEIIELLGVFNIGDYIPWVAWMDLQGCVRRSKLVSKKMKAMFGKLISERRNERRNRGSDIADIDFLDVLLTASANQTEIAITDSHITAIFSIRSAAHSNFRSTSRN